MPGRDLIPRSIRPLVLEGLEYSRIVFVGGARQVGKTTLVGDIATHERPMAAFTLDDQPTREAAIADPAGFVADLPGPAFIDEIHRAPDLLLELKKAVDADTTPGRFVITGSANVLASQRIQDALPGRIDRIDMWPLAQSEIRGAGLNLVDELFAGRPPRVTGAPAGRSAFAQVVAEGGYPEARRLPPGRVRDRWFADYIAATLARDLAELADVRRFDDAGRLLRLLATQSANLLSYRKIGARLDMHHATVQAYVALLEQMFLVKRLPAWRPGLGAREAATPKLYVCDSGLLAHLLGANQEGIENDDQITGKLCETFVVGELLRHVSWSEQQPRLHHYQRDREDVDVVLENNRGEVVGVEVKAAATLRATDWKWLRKLADARGETFKAGIVVYAGEQTLPLGTRLWAVPYSGLWAP
jgi:predicted AAA+ superfamily ATPase